MRNGRTYTDENGIERHVGSNRKVRSDKGLPKPHPAGCRHCKVVDEWRGMVEVEREAAGGWRNEWFRPSVTFFEFQAAYYAELRALDAYEAEQALAWAA